MKLTNVLFAGLLIFFCQSAHADIFWFFRENDGSTNWQYIANFVGNILILALAITAIRLYFTRRQARQYNNELEAIHKKILRKLLDILLNRFFE